jgi:hypothetical protein
MTDRAATIWCACIGAAGVVLGQILPQTLPMLVGKGPPAVLQGAVDRDDNNSAQRYPISGVKVVAEAADQSSSTPVTTDSNGLFVLPLSMEARRGGYVTLAFSHADYQDRNMIVPIIEQYPYTVYLWPRTGSAAAHLAPRPSPTATANFVTVAYQPAPPTSTVFQVVNRGNVRCNGKQPCSPDGKWKAAIGSASLDAGEGRVFASPGHADCVAGPCPWSKIEKDGFSKGGRIISVTVRNWSDTVTYRLWGNVK